MAEKKNLQLKSMREALLLGVVLALCVVWTMLNQNFIKLNNADFDSYEARPDWKGYKVYSIWLKAQEGACIGYPQYALEKNSIIRLSTLKETIAIMKNNRTDTDD